MSFKHLPLVLLTLLLSLLCACKSGTPRDVLSASKMEEVLYDYHLAQALAKTAQGDSVPYQSRLLIAAVYKKHGIEEKQFQRSMEWYARHTEELGKIYQRLAERMGDTAGPVANGSKKNNKVAQSTGTDTLLLFRAPAHLLLQSQGKNRYTFVHKADTSLQRGDMLRCTFNTAVHRRGGTQQGIALLAVRYAGDSIAYTQQSLYAAGRQTVTLRLTSARKVEEVKGLVYLASPWTERPCLFTLTDLTLTRIRLHDAPRAASPAPAAPLAPAVTPDSAGPAAARTMRNLRDSLVREEQMQKRQPHFR